MPESVRKLYPLMFLTVVVLIAVTLLSLTNSITSPIIEKRLHQQVLDQMINIFPEMGEEYDYDDDSGVFTLYDTGGEKIGYAFLAVGAGYGGEISILVGLEDAETVKGIIILSLYETPGMGSRITDAEFLDQFIGLNINDVSLSQDGGQIDGLTGATISSRAVVDAVRQTAMDKVAQIEGAD